MSTFKMPKRWPIPTLIIWLHIMSSSYIEPRYCGKSYKNIAVARLGRLQCNCWSVIVELQFLKCNALCNAQCQLQLSCSMKCTHLQGALYGCLLDCCVCFLLHEPHELSFVALVKLKWFGDLEWPLKHCGTEPRAKKKVIACKSISETEVDKYGHKVYF